MGYLWKYVYYRIMDISTLSIEEQIQIIGHYLNTKHKSSDLVKRGYTDKQLEQMKKKQRAREFMGFRFSGDLSRFTHPLYRTYLKIYRAYTDHGILPENGGMFDQPARILDILDTFDALADHEYREEKARVEKDQKRQMRNTSGRR